VGGDTTGGGLQRLDQALAGETSILVVELGANDGLRGIPIATIEENFDRQRLPAHAPVRVIAESVLPISAGAPDRRLLLQTVASGDSSG
jgi:lysophospholipase L1-like esterase